MAHTTTLKTLIGGLVLAALMLTASLAFAQEATAQASETAAAATQAPPGGGLLFLLIGLGAIVLISAIWLVRERTEVPSEV